MPKRTCRDRRCVGDGLAHRLDRVPLLTPFVGRRSELKLSDCWRRTLAGETRLAIVRAEAGMGKSRVVREFRRQLLQDGVKVLECRCRSDAQRKPLPHTVRGPLPKRRLDVVRGGAVALRSSSRSSRP